MGDKNDTTFVQITFDNSRKNSAWTPTMLPSKESSFYNQSLFDDDAPFEKKKETNTSETKPDIKSVYLKSKSFTEKLFSN